MKPFLIRVPAIALAIAIAVALACAAVARAQTDTTTRSLGTIAGVALSEKHTGWSIGSDCLLYGMRNTMADRIQVDFVIHTEDKKGKVADNKGSIELKPGQFKGGGIFLGDDVDLGRCDSDAPLVRWQLRGIRVTDLTAQENAAASRAAGAAARESLDEYRAAVSRASMQYQSGNRKDASLGAAVSRGTANVADFERRFGTPTSAANGDRYYTDLRTDIQTALAALESAMDSALTAASATAAATSAAGAAASRADSDSLDAARREDERRSAAVASRKTDQRAERDKDKAALSDGGSALLGADVGTGLIDGEFSLSIGMPFYTAKTTIGSKDGEGISVTASFYRAWKLRPDGAVRFEIGARGGTGFTQTGLLALFADTTGTAALPGDYLSSQINWGQPSAHLWLGPIAIGVIGDYRQLAVTNKSDSAVRQTQMTAMPLIAIGSNSDRSATFRLEGFMLPASPGKYSAQGASLSLGMSMLSLTVDYLTRTDPRAGAGIQSDQWVMVSAGWRLPW